MTRVSRITGKERDTETGLDYFGARYYASNMGRFLSPDPLVVQNKGSATSAAFLDYVGQPQNWNRYAYTRNNPIVLIDPDGRETQIAIGQRTANNAFGHAAIIINGRVYSFGTNYSKNPANKQDWGVDAKVYLDANTARGRATDVLTLNVTPAQEKALQQQLESNNPNSQGSHGYSILNANTCVQQVENPLIDTGMMSVSAPANQVLTGAPPNAQAPSTPGGLEGALLNQQGLVQSVQTVGETKVGFWQSLWGTIKSKLGSGN